MKKILFVLMIVFILCLGLAGCGGNDAKKVEPAKKIKIVTTIFPAYDWTRQIIGKENKNIELMLLNTTGADLHSYKPTVEDIAKISSCDMLIYVGGESEEWVKKAAGEAQNKKLKVINLLDTLGKNAKVEQAVEGMQGEEHEDHKHGADKHDHKHAEEEPEYDEHVWLSLRNAQQFVAVIEKAVSELDAKNKDVYTKNASSYIAQLKALDDNYKKAVAEAKIKAVLFADRFPFRYLVDDYNLKYYAAFVGCSAETEASFETITFLAGKVDELALHSVMTLEGSDKRIAETVVQSTSEKNAQILALDSMQSVTAKDVEAGAEYLAIMESNLNALTDALK